MLEFLANLWNGLIGFLGAVLPDSPFANMQLVGDVGMAMGWLNWVVPFGAMAALFALWIAAFVVYCVVRWVKGHSIDLVSKFNVTE